MNGERQRTTYIDNLLKDTMLNNNKTIDEVQICMGEMCGKPCLNRQVCVNSRTFQGLLKDFSTVFKDCKLMKNTDLHVKIQFLKC